MLLKTRLPRIQTPQNSVLLSVTLGAATVTCAGMIWLTQSSALATTGQRIYNLDRERQALLERRAEAMTAFAAATDPRHLEARARALGFGPLHNVEQLAVQADPAVPAVVVLDPNSPLAMTDLSATHEASAAPSLAERLLEAGVAPASAQERAVPVAIGSAP